MQFENDEEAGHFSFLWSLKCPHGIEHLRCSCVFKGIESLERRAKEAEGKVAELTDDEERQEMVRDRNLVLHALTRLVRELPAGDRGNAPGHSHRVPGIWDDGALAGQPCRLCAAYAEAVRIVGKP